jgi:D-tyrosyl-tRNA(Tyr) deacylase
LRVVVQRVSSASVAVAGQVVGRIGAGLLVLVGVANGDGPADIDYVSSKIREVRVFDDAQGRMNRSIADLGGAILLVSQFTLLGDARKGRRPAYDLAAAPDIAQGVYEALTARLRSSGVPVETGVFGARMEVTLVNDGPVTILLDSRRTF